MKILLRFVILQESVKLPIASNPLSNKNNIPNETKKNPKPAKPIPISINIKSFMNIQIN
jgi:hypothetical protein